MMSEQVNELFSALSKAQGELKAAFKDSSNPFFKSKYANFSSVVESSREALSKNGLAITQLICQEDGKYILKSILGHASGQWIMSVLPLLMAKGTPQEMGSVISYMKRYSWSALIGQATTDEDDDAEKAEEGFREQQKSSKEESELELNFWNEFSTKDNFEDIKEFLKTRTSKGKFSPQQVMKSALERPPEFLKSFNKWLAEKEANLVQT